MARQHDGKIDLVLTDIVMPVMGGKEMADALRTSHPDTKILFTSGYSQDAMGHHGVLRPGLLFLQKPYISTTLARKVREAGQAFRIYSPIRRRDHEGHAYSLVQMMLDEYLYYPFSVHDDLMDAISRVEDMEPTPPIVIDERELEPEAFSD